MADTVGVEKLKVAVDGLGALAKAAVPPIVKDGFQWVDLATAGAVLVRDAQLRARVVAGAKAIAEFRDLAAEAKDIDPEEAAKIGYAVLGLVEEVYGACKES